MIAKRRSAGAKYVVLMEDISEELHIRGFRLFSGSRPIYESFCRGHMRIIPQNKPKAKGITPELTIATETAAVKDYSLF